MISDALFNVINEYGEILAILRAVIVVIIAILIFSLILKIIRKRLLKKAKTKKQISNVNLFLNIIKYFFIFFLVLVTISSYFGSWIEFGLAAGFFTAAIGWALQKPITGIAAWVMIAVKRPFNIGDRVIISNIKGDITDVTLTHIYLEEIGGTIEGEEKSGRIIMIPNSILFEKEIINYTYQDDYILDEVVTAITYESNLKKAEEIMLTTVNKIMEPFQDKFPKRLSKDPHIRLLFRGSGIDVTVRYNTLAAKRNEIATNIRREIFNQIRKSRDVEIAYPHTEVLFREKKT